MFLKYDLFSYEKTLLRIKIFQYMKKSYNIILTRFHMTLF